MPQVQKLAQGICQNYEGCLLLRVPFFGGFEGTPTQGTTGHGPATPHLRHFPNGLGSQVDPTLQHLLSELGGPWQAVLRTWYLDVPKEHS